MVTDNQMKEALDELTKIGQENGEYDTPVIFSEAEDFELFEGGRRIGRFMVNSQEPYEINITEEVAKDDGDSVRAINRLLKSGAVIEYEPNYTVNGGLFGDVTIDKNKQDWP